TWEGNGIPCIIYKGSSQGPFLGHLVDSHQRNIMRTVLPCIKPSTVIDLIKLPFTLRKRVANPPVQFSFFLSHQEFCPVRTTYTIQKLTFQLFIGLQVCAVPEVNLVVHKLVIGFDGKLIGIIPKITEVAQCSLIRNL